MNEALMPAAFLGHGSPMNALESNRFSSAWRAFGESAPRPRAILVVSAHWYGPFTAVTAMPQPRTIHDFYGFPPELFDVEYPAPGDADFAAEVAEIAKPTHVGLDLDTWGIDHGAWSVLLHAFPRADVPVVQLSLHSQRTADDHFALGARLEPLRASGVLVVASGNVVHNLREIDWQSPTEGFDWTQRFDAAARDVLASSPDDAPGLTRHRDYPRAVPTPDHFLPVLYLAGMAAAAGRSARVLVEGFAFGSLSMTAYTIDCTCAATSDGAGLPAGLPDASKIPPEDTNT